MVESSSTRALGRIVRGRGRLGLSSLLLISALALFPRAGEASFQDPEISPRADEQAAPRVTRAESLPIPEGASVVVETERFRFVATSRAEGLARSLARDIEALRDRIAEDLGRDYDGITEVRVADRASAFQTLQPGERGAPSWAVGIAWPSLNLIVINSGHGRTPSEVRRTLAHEVSHIALGRLAPRRFPRWFLEGMAMYHSEEWSFTRAGALAGAVLRDGIIPMQDLEASWPDTPADVRLAYAQSNDFVAWLFRNHGRDSIHSLIAEVVAGRPFDDAMEIGTGFPLWKLEYEWKSSLPFRYTWLPAITSGSFIWGLMSLLFLMAYLRKRHAKLTRLAAMEEEEAWLHAPEPEAEEREETEDDQPPRMNGSSLVH